MTVMHALPGQVWSHSDALQSEATIACEKRRYRFPPIRSQEEIDAEQPRRGWWQRWSWLTVKQGENGILARLSRLYR